MPERDRSGGGYSRRSIVRGALGASAAGGIAAGTLYLTSGDAGATATIAGVSANDVSVSSGDGQIESLTVDPSLTVDWSGFPDPVAELRVSIHAEPNTGTQVVISQQPFAVPSPSTDGSHSPAIGQVNLLDKNGGVVDESELADATEDGTPEATDVTVSVLVEFYDDGDNRMDVDSGSWITESVTFTVSVDNVATSATVTGSLNTNGS